MLDQKKLLQLKKDGNDPVITLHLGAGRKKNDQELDSSELKEMRRELWVGQEGENRVGQILHFLLVSPHA